MSQFHKPLSPFKNFSLSRHHQKSKIFISTIITFQKKSIKVFRLPFSAGNNCASDRHQVVDKAPIETQS